jgi:hypothetical protein
VNCVVYGRGVVRRDVSLEGKKDERSLYCMKKNEK